MCTFHFTFVVCNLSLGMLVLAKSLRASLSTWRFSVLASVSHCYRTGIIDTTALHHRYHTGVIDIIVTTMQYHACTVLSLSVAFEEQVSFELTTTC